MHGVWLALAIVAAASGVSAQSTPAPKSQLPVSSAAAPEPAAGSTPAADPATAADSYTYNPDGRRDPFTSLMGTGGGDTRATRPLDGISTMAINDIAVRGILQSRGALVAMVQGPDNKTYIVHQGDKLLDGAIKSITPLGLVLIQDVSDPLSLVKQREVSKPLRSLEAVKP
jgi:Tfp pilus assembly protein PilP